jgi:hypothetical protein
LNPLRKEKGKLDVILEENYYNRNGERERERESRQAFIAGLPCIERKG